MVVKTKKYQPLEAIASIIKTPGYETGMKFWTMPIKEWFSLM